MGVCQEAIEQLTSNQEADCIRRALLCSLNLKTKHLCFVAARFVLPPMTEMFLEQVSGPSPNRPQGTRSSWEFSRDDTVLGKRISCLVGQKPRLDRGRGGLGLNTPCVAGQQSCFGGWYRSESRSSTLNAAMCQH